MSFTVDFADRLRMLRESRGLSQEELADRLSVSRPSVSSWETGKSRPRLAKLDELANVLETTTVYLLYGDSGRGDGSAIPDGAMRIVGTSSMVPMRRLGKTHAGDAIEEIEDAELVEVPESVARRHPSGFALTVEGDCMDRSYPDGCTILVDPDMEPRNGDDVVAEISPGESVFRRYMRGKSTLMLVADSHGDYEDMVFANEDVQEVRLLGVCVWFQAASDMSER